MIAFNSDQCPSFIFLSEKSFFAKFLLERTFFYISSLSLPFSVGFRLAGFTDGLTSSPFFARRLVLAVELPIGAFTGVVVVLILRQFSLAFFARLFVPSPFAFLIVGSTAPRFFSVRGSLLSFALLQLVLLAGVARARRRVSGVLATFSAINL